MEMLQIEYAKMEATCVAHDGSWNIGNKGDGLEYMDTQDCKRTKGYDLLICCQSAINRHCTLVRSIECIYAEILIFGLANHPCFRSRLSGDCEAAHNASEACPQGTAISWLGAWRGKNMGKGRLGISANASHECLVGSSRISAWRPGFFVLLAKFGVQPRRTKPS